MSFEISGTVLVIATTELTIVVSWFCGLVHFGSVAIVIFVVTTVLF